MGQCQRCSGTPKQLAINPQCAACVAGQKEGEDLLNGYKKNTQWKSQDRKWENVANDNNYKPIKGEKNIYAPEGRSTEKDFLDKLTTARVAVEHGYRVWILGKQANAILIIFLSAMEFSTRMTSNECKASIVLNKTLLNRKVRPIEW